MATESGKVIEENYCEDLKSMQCNVHDLHAERWMP